MVEKVNSNSGYKFVCPADNTVVQVPRQKVGELGNYSPSVFKANDKVNTNKAQNVKPLELDGEQSFDTKTTGLFGKCYAHKTRLLDIAQSNLGLIEVTPKEYVTLSPNQKQKTQMKIVGELGGDANQQWCAYTVSYMAKQAKMNIGGSKARVSDFISWANRKGTYNSIKSKPMTAAKMSIERANRAAQIKEQLPSMHEGDFIIWKNDYAVNTTKGVDINNSSHIGIIETVDKNRGVVTVIEGNANESVDPAGNAERVKITKNNKSTLGVNGNQIEDEYQEVNRRDGLIRKEYTIQELANFGYSGFIDNSKIVK